MGRKTLLDRFEEKYIPVTESGCWLWIGATGHHGYGRLWDGKRAALAHRVAYSIYKGEFVGELDHWCNVHGCVNPDHLSVMSRRDNMLRSDAPSAINARKTECPRGHCLVGSNLVNTTKGNRVCKICAKLKMRRRTGSSLPYHE